MWKVAHTHTHIFSEQTGCSEFIYIYADTAAHSITEQRHALNDKIQDRVRNETKRNKLTKTWDTNAT